MPTFEPARTGTYFSLVSLILLGRTVHNAHHLSPPYRPLRTVHSALCTRVLINLRKAAAHISKSTLSEFTMDTTLAFRSVDVTSLRSLEPGELEHCGYHPHHMGFPSPCSSSESVITSGSAEDMGAGQWA